MWVDIPMLPGASASMLARLASEEDAVEDMRLRVRRALKHVRSVNEGAENIEGLVDELHAAGRQLRKTAATSKRWGRDLVLAGASASLMIGYAGVSPLVAGTIGAVANVFPYYGEVLNKKRDAAYLFYRVGKPPMISRRRR
jgi:hypothetical protein